VRKGDNDLLVVRVYEVQFGSLDMEYLGKWVETLALQSYWERLLREASPF